MRFKTCLAAGVAAFWSVGVSSQVPPPASPVVREIAITMDDLPGVSAAERTTAHLQQLTRGVLAAFARHRVPAIGFVNENKLDRDGAPDPDRVALLRHWTDTGLELGNHTYAHLDLHRVPRRDVEADVRRGELVTRQLMESAGTRLRYFRHPFLHTGRSLEIRRGFETFLAERGYAGAPVTIDNSDYVFAAAYDRLAAAGDDAQTDRVVTTYLDYMNRVVGYYEEQSQALLGRPMRHTLLLHANALNARALHQWLPMLEARGYRFVSLDHALEDPAYASKDDYVGAAGITWLHRWALTAGQRGTFFAGEPEVPAWVTERAQH